MAPGRPPLNSGWRREAGIVFAMFASWLAKRRRAAFVGVLDLARSSAQRRGGWMDWLLVVHRGFAFRRLSYPRYTRTDNSQIGFDLSVERPAVPFPEPESLLRWPPVPGLVHPGCVGGGRGCRCRETAGSHRPPSNHVCVFLRVTCLPRACFYPGRF